MLSGGRRSTIRRVAARHAALVCVAAIGCGGDPVPSGLPGSRDAGASASTQVVMGRRVALVVGNDDYVDVAPLRNAVNDARAVASALEGVGFAVERVENTTEEGLETALAAFAGSLQSEDEALFYFAGHGMEVDGQNYLIPTDFDFDPENEEGVRFDAVNAADVQEMLQRARVAILVFDACRDNPYRGFRNTGGGLAPMEARGTLIAYAAGAGEVAADAAPGAENGLFTSRFVEALDEPGLTASELFRRVRREVFAASNEDQWPAVYDDLLSDFVFRPADGEPGGDGAGLAEVAPAGAEVASGGSDADRVAHEQETVFWESIRDSRDAADFEAYKRRFPGGVYVELADNRLAALAAAAEAPTLVSSSSSADGREAAWQADERALGLDSGERRRVQRTLRVLGYDPGGVDGVLGNGTRAAIRAWQASRGVEATGYLSAGDVAQLSAQVEEGNLSFELPSFELLEGANIIERGTASPTLVEIRDAAILSGAPVGAVFSDCAGCPSLVVVPAGTFRMGSPSSEPGRIGDDEGPQHSVTIPSAFAAGVYEVTFYEWDQCVSAGGCGGYRPNDEGWGRGQRPVMNVSWEDAQAYVRWLSARTGESYSLLSESEWEYVARGGTRAAYWWGNWIQNRNLANCRDCGSSWDNRETAPVGSFSENGFSVHDVMGNVWEWVEDCWHDGYSGAPIDGSAWTRVDGSGSGDCSRRVIRGGSFLEASRYLRSAYRFRSVVDNRVRSIGFRVRRRLD